MVEMLRDGEKAPVYRTRTTAHAFSAREVPAIKVRRAPSRRRQACREILVEQRLRDRVGARIRIAVVVGRPEVHLKRREHAPRALIEHAIGRDVVTVARELQLQLAHVDERMRIARTEPRGDGRIVGPRADAGLRERMPRKERAGSILRCGAMSLWPTTRVGGMP
jgi:hypothetical protein